MSGDCGSVFTWTLDKQMCEILQNSTVLLGLYFVPTNQIVNIYMNGLRRQVSTCDKTLTWPWMDEPSISLDLEH